MSIQALFLTSRFIMSRQSTDSTISQAPPAYSTVAEKKAPSNKLGRLLQRFKALFKRKEPVVQVQDHERDLEQLMQEQAMREARRLAREQRRPRYEAEMKVLQKEEAATKLNIRHGEAWIRSDELEVKGLDVKIKASKLERAQTEQSLEAAIRSRESRAVKRELQDRIDLLRLWIEEREVDRETVQARIDTAKVGIEFEKSQLEYLDARKEELVTWKDGSGV